MAGTAQNPGQTRRPRPVRPRLRTPPGPTGLWVPPEVGTGRFGMGEGPAGDLGTARRSRATRYVEPSPNGLRFVGYGTLQIAVAPSDLCEWTIKSRGSENTPKILIDHRASRMVYVVKRSERGNLWRKATKFVPQTEKFPGHRKFVSFLEKCLRIGKSWIVQPVCAGLTQVRFFGSWRVFETFGGF